jgi:hypothetical protein
LLATLTAAAAAVLSPLLLRWTPSLLCQLPTTPVAAAATSTTH